MRIEYPSSAHIQQLLTLWKRIFGDWDGFWELFLDTAFLPARCRCVMDGEDICAALCWFDVSCGDQKMAYLYAVLTHPDHRGKGLCRMLMEDTHAVLAAKGYSAALLVPEKEGLREMYRKMGYRNCTSVAEVTCTAATAPISLRAIGPEEYAALRRDFLPRSGVLQEGENLRFLAGQVQFYTGTNFLMAAYTEGTQLHAPELLGDAQAAPGILAALQCEKGLFRTPGEGRAFAMFHPLTEKAAVPEYFGFAFD